MIVLAMAKCRIEVFGSDKHPCHEEGNCHTTHVIAEIKNVLAIQK